MGNKNSFACSFKQDGVDFSEDGGSKWSTICSHNYRGLATLSKNNFNFHFVIGRGGFGKVWSPFLLESSFIRLWIGLESWVPKKHASVCHERNV